MERNRKSIFKRINSNTLQLLCICLIVFAVFSILKPSKFPTLKNLDSMSFQLPETGLFTLGIAITMLTAGADLSIVAVANLVATLNGILWINYMSADPAASPAVYLLLCVGIAIVMGLLCGALNGFLVAKLGIFPILATLGTQNLYTGISAALTKGQGVFGTFPDNLVYIGGGKLFGFLAVPMAIFLVVLAVVSVIIHCTPHGYKTQWFGSNSKASFYCGINNVKTVWITYEMAALIGAVAGIIILARTNSAKYDYGTTLVTQALLASVLAGISPSGGKGNILNVFLSVLCIQLLNSGFNFLRVSSFVRSSTYGILLILSMIAEHLRQALVMKAYVRRLQKIETKE